MKDICKTKVYMRITGYFSDLDLFNPGKKEEVKDRKKYKIDKSTLPQTLAKEVEYLGEGD